MLFPQCHYHPVVIFLKIAYFVLWDFPLIIFRTGIFSRSLSSGSLFHFCEYEILIGRVYYRGKWNGWETSLGLNSTSPYTGTETLHHLLNLFELQLVNLQNPYLPPHLSLSCRPIVLPTVQQPKS